MKFGGALGGALAGISADSRGKEFVEKIIAGRESVFMYDLVSEVETIVKTEINSLQKRTPLNNDLPIGGNKILELEPWVFVVYDTDGVDGFISTYMRTLLKDNKDAKIWRAGYNYRSAISRPFEGADGWFADNGKLLKDEVHRCFYEAAKVMLRDFEGPNAGWDNKPAKVKVNTPGFSKPLEMDVLLLKQEDGIVIYTPKTSEAAALVYGVNIVPHDDIVIKGPDGGPQ